MREKYIMKIKKEDISNIVAPRLLQLIEHKKLNASTDFATHLDVKDKLVKCLEKRKLKVIDTAFSHFTEEDKVKVDSSLIEFIYKDKLVILDAQIIDRFQ